MKASDKIGNVLNTIFSKKDYKFIKDTDHSNFPGPGFHRTETGWSNREETSEVGRNNKNKKNNSYYEESSKNRPIVKRLRELNEESVVIEGTLDGMYFCVLGDLSIDAIDEETKSNVSNKINEFLAEKNIERMFPLQRKEYIEIVRHLISFGCNIQKIFLI